MRKFSAVIGALIRGGLGIAALGSASQAQLSLNYWNKQLLDY